MDAFRDAMRSSIRLEEFHRNRRIVGSFEGRIRAYLVGECVYGNVRKLDIQTR